MAVLQAVGKKSVPPEVAFSWWGCQGTMARSRTWGHLPLAHIIPEAGAQSPPSGSFPPTGSSALVVPTNSPLLGPMSHIYGLRSPPSLLSGTQASVSPVMGLSELPSSGESAHTSL